MLLMKVGRPAGRFRRHVAPNARLVVSHATPSSTSFFFDPGRRLPVDDSFAFHYVSIAAERVAQLTSNWLTGHEKAKNGIQIP